MKRLDEIFNVWYGVNMEVVNSDVVEKGIPFISRTSMNNGLTCYVKKLDNITPNPANTLSIAVSGSVLSTFYQEKEYYSGRDVYIAQPKEQLSKVEMLYYCYVIELNKFKYNYGRGANCSFRSLLLPEPSEVHLSLNKNVEPQFIHQPLSAQKLELKTDEWKWFKIGDLFQEIYKAKAHVKQEVNITNDLANGLIFISRTETDNGCDVFVERDDSIVVESGNAIIIGDTTATCFYQEKEFTTGDHIIVCRSNWLNKNTALFFKTIMDNEKYRFNYGRAFKMELVREHRIKLPATTNKNGKTFPDWQWMEDYIKGLPYSGAI